jgi:hypothetical protein
MGLRPLEPRLSIYGWLTTLTRRLIKYYLSDKSGS